MCSPRSWTKTSSITARPCSIALKAGKTSARASSLRRRPCLTWTCHLEDIIAEGDLVGVRGTMRCTHQGTFLGVPGTGHELSWKGLAMFRIADGKIAERWFNSDSVSIVRQLGLATARIPSEG